MTMARHGLPNSRPCAVATCRQRHSLLVSDPDANVWFGSILLKNAELVVLLGG
jgi:hypothetical protein